MRCRSGWSRACESGACKMRFECLWSHGPTLKRLGTAALLAGAALVGGCASQGVDYPSIANITKIGKEILTPEQKEAAMKELAAERETHNEKAAKEIEKRN
jgi:hypothetical protein